MQKLLFVVLFGSSVAVAQFTTVSGTVTDPNGLPYANGTIAATLNISASPTLSGFAYTPPTQPVGLSSTGVFIMQLADNNVLLPGSSQWNFHVCSSQATVQPAIGKGPVCFDSGSITITGSSQSITAQLTAAALALTVPIGGGGGTPGGSSTQIQFNNSGAFGGLSNVASGSWLASQGTSTSPVFQSKDFVDVRDYYGGNGVKCDGSLHPLSAFYGSLAAAQAVYPFITSLTQQLDYAAAKLAANTAFGPDGSEHATNTGLNKPLRFPAGTCMFAGDTLLIRNADGIIIHGWGMTATVLQGNSIVLGFDGLWYSQISDFEVLTTSSGATVAFDMDGNVPGHPYPTRSVQGNLLQNLLVSGGNSSYAMAHCRLGGNNAQCSEDTMINVHLSNASSAGLLIEGFNALDNVWSGGDIQGHTKNGILLDNSTLKLIGVSFEAVVGCTQLNNGGNDVQANGGVNGSVVVIGSRTEGLVPISIGGGAFAYVTGLTQNAAYSTWTAGGTVVSAEAIKKTGTDSKPHLYCATTPGTSGGVEPTWPATGTVADGTAVWTETDFTAVSTVGTFDSASSFIDSAAIVTVTNPVETKIGAYNTPSPSGTSFLGQYVAPANNIDEVYLTNQGQWESFYVNSNSSPVASHFQPTFNLPASSQGVIALNIGASKGFTVVGRLNLTEAINGKSTVPTIAGCGTISNQIGSGLAGTFQTNATSCTPVFSGMPNTTTGFACTIWDQTHITFPMGNLSSTVNTVTFGNFITTASDVIAFQCGVEY